MVSNCPSTWKSKNVKGWYLTLRHLIQQAGALNLLLRWKSRRTEMILFACRHLIYEIVLSFVFNASMGRSTRLSQSIWPCVFHRINVYSVKWMYLTLQKYLWCIATFGWRGRTYIDYFARKWDKPNESYSGSVLFVVVWKPTKFAEHILWKFF